MSESLQFGFVGSGMIARVVADAVKRSGVAVVTAVASKHPENAACFAKEFEVELVYESWQELVASAAIDAVYVCTPTSIEEEIAVAAAKAKKHVLADKPFASVKALENIIAACEENGVLFMDATHFVHNPRTVALQAAIKNEIGGAEVIRSAFFVPITDVSNIRFDPTKEPTGSFGDLGWYNMRAIVEFLPERTEVEHAVINVVRHPETKAVVRASGALTFDNGMSSTWDVGYDMGSIMMDLDIIGAKGILSVSDFVLDWAKGFAFNYQDEAVGFHFRKDKQAPSEWSFIETPSELPQAALMIQSFERLRLSPNSHEARGFAARSLATQQLLDLLWSSGSH